MTAIWFAESGFAVETFRSKGYLPPSEQEGPSFVAGSSGDARRGSVRRAGRPGGVIDQAVGVLIGRGAEDADEGLRLLVRTAERSGSTVEGTAREVLDVAQRRAWSSLTATSAAPNEVLRARPDVALLSQIIELASSLLAEVGGVSIVVQCGQRLRTVAATGPAAEELDHLQGLRGQGPSFETIRTGVPSVVSDIGADGRWPEFAASVAQSGVRSMLCLRLGSDEMTSAALSLHTSAVGSFHDEAVAAGALLAGVASRALSCSYWQDRAGNLERALRRNREIGTALGILMAERRLTQMEAFNAMRVASQHAHRKLHDVALDVIDTGTLIDVPQATGPLRPVGQITNSR